MRVLALFLLIALSFGNVGDDTNNESHFQDQEEVTETAAVQSVDESVAANTVTTCLDHQVLVQLDPYGPACLNKLSCEVRLAVDCEECDATTKECTKCVHGSNGGCLQTKVSGVVGMEACDGGKKYPGSSICIPQAILEMHASPDSAIGATSTQTSTFDVDALMADCTYDPMYGHYDPVGLTACNWAMSYVTNIAVNYAAMADVRCYVNKLSETAEFYSAENPNGKCDCVYPKSLGSDAACHELTCEATTSGPGCAVCADPLTRNNECAVCHSGYVLVNGDCLENICTEDPDNWEWQGCQECRPLESRRHPQDCLQCAHGYHYMHEQRNTPNQTDTTQYSTGSLVVQGEETGYCFPYHCEAGGNLLNPMDASDMYQFISDPYQRTIKITAVVSTDHNSLDPSIHALSTEVLAFRDHCKTCVPQQKREKDDHCETCNDGYYLDEMHHTCRKKTCGIPHFRRNAVSCTAENLVPKPWSTPCTNCQDNSVGDEDACCVFVPPVMTCGAQNIFCAPGTHKAGFDSLPCYDCTHYTSACCDPLTCDNQQVACRVDQNRLDGSTGCTNCLQGGDECCADKPRTCGNSNVECGHRQDYKGDETACDACANNGLECCTPITKTCQNMGVFCHAGTHKFHQGGENVVCGDCENYDSECCEDTTCSNQRVPCMVGRAHKGDVVCVDCIANTDECCEPLPPVQDTCGNQAVKCRHNLYRPAGTHCESEQGTCNDYGETCCVQPTCGNQGVGCSSVQAELGDDTSCTSCADNGDECCTDDRTCGLMGVQCALGGYRSPDTPCTNCDHFDTEECCHTVATTCSNQGVICLPGTHRAIDTGCTHCGHYSDECCAPQTCGNQGVGCSRGRARLGDTVECDSCHDDSDECCAPLQRTCHAMGVKCMNGHYNAGQADIDCGDNCTNYVEPCCTEFVSTCGNQDVVCSDDQSYLAPSTTCDDCVNHGSECCEDVTKTCANQGVVCRPDHKVADYANTECGDCLNDALPCCTPYQKTCGSENVVCSAQQTYKLPSTHCSGCENNGGDCCVDVAPTCDNQRVSCRPGHYADDYHGKACESCLNDDTNECCVAYVTTCGNQNVQCNDHHTPRNPDTPCSGEGCHHNSDTCCVDVTDTCANQAVVCRAGHYADGYAGIECGASGCLNDAQPCCSDYVPTCGTSNVKCSPNQTYRDADTLCNGSCESYGATCCVDVTHTCGNQGVSCRPGYYVEGYQQVSCEADGCAHHSAPCCELFEKTCGNQDVVCSAGQTYEEPSTVCNNCHNHGSDCCVDVQKTCDNQGVVCLAGHYAADYQGMHCDGCLNDDEDECCTHFQTTCGNANTKCSRHHEPVDPDTACDGEECDNNSATCCVPVSATCANQNVVCRPGHYADGYAQQLCASTGCLNDQQPCCDDYVKTCQNQNVQCSLGLMKHKADAELPCDKCQSYGDECCEPITKTCGNSGADCRQDLYKPQDTGCDGCGVDECCEPIPVPDPTCANTLYVCDSDSLGKKGYYKPGDSLCPDGGKCDDATCCHSFPVTCGNQNVQCHTDTYLHKDTECTQCDHYGYECCEAQTCADAGVTCDSRYYYKVSNFESASCAGADGECSLVNDAPPCCLPNQSEVAAPTCTNKFGIDDGDLTDWPFLNHLMAVKTVTCDSSKGYYRKEAAFTNGGNTCGPAAGTACEQNDPNCCWRKTCKPNDNTNNGYGNHGEGPLEEEFVDVECGTGYTMKDNAEYIVCTGDCHSDCCDKIPDPDTCMSERVACSHGYERKSDWQTAECGAECVENSAVCCQRTTCLQATCDVETQTHKAGALCFDCHNNGEECCDMIPIDDTCSNQRVHCGYGFYKVAAYEGKKCDDCYDDGAECCRPKTCGSRGVEDVVTCTSGLFNHKDLEGRCHTCVDDGAECCDPVIPEKTCQNQDVNCGFGFVHNDVTTGCKDCLDNGDECCTQNTCANTGTGCTDEGLKARAGDTLCTLCMSNRDECCTKQDTCWTSKVVCPGNTYHKHPNLICGDDCDVEHCCAAKTCENQGVCCNANLGFSQVANFADQECSSCADNCEECCSYDTPTCSSAQVGCGFGYHRKNGADDVECTTCALNDHSCCEPRTCGADADIDGRYECPDGYDYLGDDIKCHFCEKAECCKPTKPVETCRSENINCGVGMTRVPGSDDEPCSTCVQNDSVCCEGLTCDARTTCPGTHTNKGAVLCVGCSVDECCDVVPTCASENVGCGFGFKPTEGDSQECTTCALNDSACCEQTTCGSEGYQCPDGFAKVEDQGKKCAFCELSECCVPIIPTKTCSNQSVGCGHGFTAIPGSEETACGTCELNNLNCCAQDYCSTCPDGYHRLETVDKCGFCTVEECCERDEDPDTCENQQVGCGFGWKELAHDRSVALCSTCSHNDAMCCEQKTCGADGPVCGDHLKQSLPYTEKGAQMPCSDCDLEQCCVPPVIQQTCVNQRVGCSGHFDTVGGYQSATCEQCLHNGGECCQQRTCANQGVDCNRDIFTHVTDYDSRTCLECADNTLECCEPKLCGHHFLDVGQGCNAETHSTNARNTPCVNCDTSECCTVHPTLKCAEIIIEHGQAFYSQPMGPGSERTRGSVLSVECDLGYKFQTAEYTHSGDLNTPDQDVAVIDYPVCDPVLIEDLIEGHVEVFSPTTSGWNRAPPVCRPVSCPPLNVASEFTPDAVDKYNIGYVTYVDAQMDDVPLRGAGMGPRDYAGEADVVCNEGWIRVPNVCVEADTVAEDEHTENTLEYELKGFWRLEGNTQDQSPHCLASRSDGDVGSCNDGGYSGGQEDYVEGAPINGEPSQGLRFDGTSQYIAVHDGNNPNWGQWRGDNELNIDATQWTASLSAFVDADSNEHDGYMFARYTESYKEIVTISLTNGWLGVVYNDGPKVHVEDAKFPTGRWVSVIVRMDGQKLQIWVDGVMKVNKDEDTKIADTAAGHVFIGADRENSGTMNGFFDGLLDEVRYYTRGITDEEIACIAAGKLTCSHSKYYAKPYNTQGCNRASEEITSADECREAINQLLQDSVLGNSLNGGQRFGRTIQDDQKEAAYDDVPAKCSYREEDAQIIFNPAATGRAHTSLSPICRTNPVGADLQTVGCLPKCLNNGLWSVALPTCEKDWCNPIFEEWSCCENRIAEKSQSYYLNHHEQSVPACPIGYGDCDNDDDCLREGSVYGVCSQQRDLDNIDVCITDLDPCGGVKGATGTMCVVMTAVGVDYHASAESGHKMFLGGAILLFGSLAGYYLMKPKKGDEHRALLEEEL